MTQYEKEQQAKSLLKKGMPPREVQQRTGLNLAWIEAQQIKRLL